MTDTLVYHEAMSCKKQLCTLQTVCTVTHAKCLTFKQSQLRPADHTASVPSTPPLNRWVGAAAPTGTYNATAEIGPSPGFMRNPRSFWLCRRKTTVTPTSHCGHSATDQRKFAACLSDSGACKASNISCLQSFQWIHSHHPDKQSIEAPLRERKLTATSGNKASPVFHRYVADRQHLLKQ